MGIFLILIREFKLVVKTMFYLRQSLNKIKRARKINKKKMPIKNSIEKVKYPTRRLML